MRYGRGTIQNNIHRLKRHDREENKFSRFSTKISNEKITFSIKSLEMMIVVIRSMKQVFKCKTRIMNTTTSHSNNFIHNLNCY